MIYSVVIPIFNGERTISKLCILIEEFFRQANLVYELILVHDCGKDNSWVELEELKKRYNTQITIIKLSRNFGQHNAIICGLAHAKGDFIITMDEDLQHKPIDIKNLISEQQKGDYDIVYGKYAIRKHSSFRNLGSNFLRWLISKSIPDIHADYSAFRLIKANIAKSVVSMQNSYTFLDGYLSWITTNTSSCLVSHNERQGGVTSYSFKKLINHSINIFVTFSNFPIRLLIIFSIFIFVLNSIFSSYIIIRKLIFNDFAMGFPSLFVAIIFGVSIIMLSVGLLGEYIYQINLKTTKKPNYFISEIK
jgi:glycosyltransferase involved in cell wall biosynthesis